MFTVSVASPVLVNPASRLTLCLRVPLENAERVDSGEASSPASRVHDDEVLACPTAWNWAETAAFAGPAGSQASAAVSVVQADTASTRRDVTDLRIGVL